MPELSLPEKIEVFLLGYARRWQIGHASGSDAINAHQTASFSLEKATQEQRNQALDLLTKKYGINAEIAPENGRDVIKVTDGGANCDIQKLNAALQFANPMGWNETPTTNEKAPPSLNLLIESMTKDQINYCQGLLQKWKIPNEVTLSQSLGSQMFIRVTGRDNIATLRKNLPTLRAAEQAQPVQENKTTSRPAPPIRKAARYTT